jgi:hypothetical protein
MSFRRLPVLLLIAAVSLIAGCGKSEMPMHVDAAVEATEEALTAVLLGNASDVGATGLAPPDKPLLVKGLHDLVYVNADEQGFAALSKGAISVAGVQEIEQRVLKTINRNIDRKGFSAVRTTFPAPADLIGKEHALIATLMPGTEDAGSPQDRAQGKGKTLVLVRLTISDAATGNVLSERDYYSGNDVRRPSDTNR